MTHFPAALLFTLVLLLPLGASKGEEKPYGAVSAEALLNQINQAIATKSKTTFLKAVCWNRLTDKLRTRFTVSQPFFATLTVTSTKLVAGGKDPYEREGFRYNIDYQGYIEIAYKERNQPIKMPYGKHQGRFFLATMVKNATYGTLEKADGLPQGTP